MKMRPWVGEGRGKKKEGGGGKKKKKKRNATPSSTAASGGPGAVLGEKKGKRGEKKRGAFTIL